MKKMKNSEIIKYITGARMPDIEQVRANCLNPPFENASRKTSGNKRFKLKPAIIAAAILIAAVVLISATGRIILRKFIDADGNIGLKEGVGRFLDWSDDEKSVFEREFNDYWNDENLLVCTLASDYRCIGHTKPHRIIKDFSELQNYIDGDIFKLPQYLPDGYEFDEAEVRFFLDESFDFENAELVVREEKFGNIYVKYFIPENLKNIEYLYVRYKNKEDNGYSDYENTINYSINLYPSEDINKEIIGWQNTQFEILDMSQFSRGVLQSTVFENSDEPIAECIFSGLNSISVRYGFCLLNQKQLEEMGAGQKEREEYGTAYYGINMHSYSAENNLREEIIKIAESIK